MKIHKESTWLELDELYENSKGVDLPYYVERSSSNGIIVWFGLETNWKYFNDSWHILRDGSWVKSSAPKYEEIYLKLSEKQ